MIFTDLFESPEPCPECGGVSFSDLVLAEKHDACYNKVRSRYKVWPSAYASGALVQCRKKGAANWGNKSKNESMSEGRDMCHVCGQTPCNCTHLNEAVAAPGRKLIELFNLIYSNGGDDAVDYLLYNSPIFADYYDQYEGDLESIAAEVDAKELQVMVDELEEVAENEGLAEGWREKLAGAALAGAMTFGGAGKAMANDAPVNPDQDRPAVTQVQKQKVDMEKVYQLDQKMQDTNPKYAQERAQLPSMVRGIGPAASARNEKVWNMVADLLVKYGQRVNESMSEGLGQNLSVQQLATISDEALDKAYGYGRSTPGNTFGWQANLMSAAYAKKMIDAGVTDIEAISDAIHKGWNVTAQKFVQNPDQFDDTEKLRQAGKLDAKLQQRAKLMKINYAQLDNEEQEKDRVVARALLQAIKGQQSVAEGLNEFAPDGFNSGGDGSGKSGKGPKARAKAQMIKAYGPGIITFRKTSNGGYFIQHEDDFGDTNSHQYDPQTGKVDFSGVTRSSYYGEGVAEGYSLGKVLPLPELLDQIKHILAAKHPGIGWRMTMPAENTFLFSARNDYDVWSMLVVESGGDDWVDVGHGMVDPDGKPIIFDRQQLPMTLASASEIADEAIQTYHDIDLSDYADDEDYNQGVAEGKMAELEMDIEDSEISDSQFEKMYGMTRKEAREQFSQTDMWAFPEIRDPNQPLHEKGVAEGSNDTVYPNAEVIKSKNGKPVGEIYQDGNGWGCFHYRADRGYDTIDSREDAIQALKDLHSETARHRPDYTIKGVAEMDKRQPSHGRDGRISHSTYGSRDRGGSTGPEHTAQATTADKMMKDAYKEMMKSMSNTEKADKGWRNPNMDEGSGLSDRTLIGYLTKVAADAQKHQADPTKRSPEKASRSVGGFAQAFNKLDARKEPVNEISPEGPDSDEDYREWERLKDVHKQPYSPDWDDDDEKFMQKWYQERGLEETTDQEADYGKSYQDMVKRMGAKAREQEQSRPVDISDLARRLRDIEKKSGN